jgi:plasmid replication initiation protein
MIARRSLDPQFDLFVPSVADLPLRDQRETMERPFFSLAKRKRLKPIEYTSPNGEVFVNVYPNPEFGMATIWDADVLIWAASTLNDMRKRGINDLPRTLHFHPHDLLRTICRETGGRQYLLLRESLARLQATSIVTNIRVQRGKKHRQFSWIESWTDLVDEETNQSKGMSLTLSEWFYEGILMDGGLLSVDPLYFSITGGRERWLYRVARKHSGGAGEGGFAIPLQTLFEKSGAEGTYRRFKFEIQSLVRRNDLPGFNLALETGKGEPSLRMIRQEMTAASLPSRPPASVRTLAAKSVRPGKCIKPILPLFSARVLSAKAIERIRADFPGWDVYALQADFDTWLSEREAREPKDYEAAFYGFVRRIHARAGA